MNRRDGWRVSRGMLPFLAIHAVNEYYRSDRKPPVTAGLLAANTLIFLRPGVLDSILPTVNEVSFNPYLILKYGDFKRFFLSAFYHMDESHLVYNMMSLIWKGIQLETQVGSVEYASMIATLLGMSQGITLVLAKSLVFFGHDTDYYYTHAVGFSGVLFAMKVILNSQEDNYTSVHGLVVPARYAAWAELILIQMFTPGVSFLGHLGGILAGLLYLSLKGSSYSGSNPLAAIIRGVTGILSLPIKLARDMFRIRRRRISGRGAVGGNQVGRNSGNWQCSACTLINSELLNTCEACNTERNDNESSVRPPNRNRNPSLEELRQRRIQRFNA